MIYVGKHSTDNLNDGYMGSGIHIKRAIKKYGAENFTKDYLAFCDTEDTLNYLECFYIKKYKAAENGYNLSSGGDGGNNYLCKSDKEMNEIKHKLSEALKGKPKSEEHKKHLSKSLKGRIPWNKGKTNVYSEGTLK